MQKEDKPLVVSKHELPIYVSPGDSFKVIALLTKENSPNANLYIGLTDAKPGTKIPMHDHGDVFEALYIISGSGKLTVEGKSFRVIPGSFTYMPAHVRHSFINDRDETMSAIQIYGPAGVWENRYFKWPKLEDILENAESGDVLK